MAEELTITRGFAPGAIGRVVEIHGRYYANEWGFGSQFETEVATELADFINRYDLAKDGFWLAWRGDRITASLTLDHAGDDGMARVCWFGAEPEMQGSGVGGKLFDQLLAFARETGQNAAYLWTFKGLTAARKLYDRADFVVSEECEENDWGPVITAQRVIVRL